MLKGLMTDIIYGYSAEDTSDSDYLFTLNENELEFQEVFGVDAEGNYRYFGETMIFEEETVTLGELGDMTLYSWGNYETVHGKWEIVGKVKQEFCDDMINSIRGAVSL